MRINAGVVTRARAGAYGGAGHGAQILPGGAGCGAQVCALCVPAHPREALVALTL